MSQLLETNIKWTKEIRSLLLKIPGTPLPIPEPLYRYKQRGDSIRAYEKFTYKGLNNDEIALLKSLKEQMEKDCSLFFNLDLKDYLLFFHPGTISYLKYISPLRPLDLFALIDHLQKNTLEEVHAKIINYILTSDDEERNLNLERLLHDYIKLPKTNYYEPVRKHVVHIYNMNVRRVNNINLENYNKTPRKIPFLSFTNISTYKLNKLILIQLCLWFQLIPIENHESLNDCYELFLYRHGAIKFDKYYYSPSQLIRIFDNLLTSMNCKETTLKKLSYLFNVPSVQDPLNSPNSKGLKCSWCEGDLMFLYDSGNQGCIANRLADYEQRETKKARITTEERKPGLLTVKRIMSYKEISDILDDLR